MTSSIETVGAIVEGMRRGRKPNQLALDFLAAHRYASRIYNGGLYKIVDSLLDVEGTSEALRRLGSEELAREVVSVLDVIGVKPGTWQETLAEERDHRGWRGKVFGKLDCIQTDLPERIWTLLSVIASREPDLWEDGPNTIHPT
jgi:hypothetical protein